jgi:hypothetical protein
LAYFFRSSRYVLILKKWVGQGDQIGRKFA